MSPETVNIIVGLITAIGTFVSVKLWPFIEKRLAARDDLQRQLEQTELALESTERKERDERYLKSNEQSSAALASIAYSLETLARVRTSDNFLLTRIERNVERLLWRSVFPHEGDGPYAKTEPPAIVSPNGEPIKPTDPLRTEYKIGAPNIPVIRD